MARQVLPIAGAVASTFLGGSPQLGFAIGSLIGNLVDPQRIKAPGLKEFPVLGVTEGAYRQVAYGTTVIRDCQLIDWGPLDPVIVEERQGKGGGPIVESQRLYQTYAVAIGEPIEAVRYIKRDGVMVYDLRPGSTILPESADFAGRLRIYLGDEAQLPDPDLEALATNGVGNTPSYRGTSYFVVVRDDLTDLGGRIPTYEVEVLQTLSGEDNPYPQLMTTGKTYGGDRTALVASTAVVGWGSNIDHVTMSPAGGYAVGSDRYALAGTYFQLRKYNLSTGVWDVLADPADMPPQGPAWTAWSSDGVYLALAVGDVGSADNVMVYKRTGDTFTKLAPPAQMPSQAVVHVVWDAADSRLAFVNATTGDSVVLYDFVGDSLVNRQYINTALLGLSWNRLDFNPTSSRYLIAGSVDSTLTYLALFDLTDLSTVLYFLAEASEGIFWDATGGYVFTVGADGPDYLQVWEFAGGVGSETLTLVDAFAYQPGTYPVASAMTPDRRFLAVGISSSDVPLIFDCAGVTPPAPVKLTNPASAVEDVISLSWSAPSAATIGDNGVLLSAIVADTCDRCGIPAGKLDLAELTDEVKGITLGGAYDGAGAITTLMPPYFFDLFEADKQIHAPKRGGAVKATISEADFIEDPDENSLRGQDIEYPRKLQLKYLNPSQNYAAPAAVVARTTPDIRVRGEAQIDLPICMDETEALRTADRILKTMWEDLNGEVSFSLPAGPFAWLAPTDCLGLSLRGALYRVRVEKVQDVDGVLQVTARRDRQSAYTSTLTAIPLPPPAGPPPSLAGITQFVVLNIPGVQDADDQIGVRIGVCGLPGTAWAGATVRYSIDAGASWTSLGSFTTPARMGTLTAGLPTNLPGYTDATNPLQVLMLDDRQLEAVTQLQLLQEGNGAAIANPDGTAELIQFRDVVDEGARAWTLRTLLRGGLNTGAAAHSAGAKFVMLDGTTFVPLPTSLIGQTIRFQFVSSGTSPETAPTFDLVWNPAVAQTEFPPASLSLTRGSGLVGASWAPRERFGTDINPVASINTAGLGWRVTLTDGTVTQVHDVLTPSLSTSDSAFTGPITATVQQLNRITGAGPGTSGII